MFENEAFLLQNEEIVEIFAVKGVSSCKQCANPPGDMKFRAPTWPEF